MGHHDREHHGPSRQVGDDSMNDRRWYLVESKVIPSANGKSHRFGKVPHYAIRSDAEKELGIRGDKVINEEPLTWSEAKVFIKLLQECNHDSE